LTEKLEILVIFLCGRSACGGPIRQAQGGQDSDERAGRPILIRPPMRARRQKMGFEKGDFDGGKSVFCLDYSG
jgi:hypothetical protein